MSFVQLNHSWNAGLNAPEPPTNDVRSSERQCITEGPAMPVSAEVATLFLDELAGRNIEVKLDDEGNYTLDARGLSINVSLENVSRDFERDRDPDRIVTFVDSITNLLALPDWQEAKGRIRWQPEPNDHKFGDTLRDPLSDKVSLVFVYVDPSDTQIRWLTAADADKWNKARADLAAVFIRKSPGRSFRRCPKAPQSPARNCGASGSRSTGSTCRVGRGALLRAVPTRARRVVGTLRFASPTRPPYGVQCALAIFRARRQPDRAAIGG